MSLTCFVLGVQKHLQVEGLLHKATATTFQVCYIYIHLMLQWSIFYCCYHDTIISKSVGQRPPANDMGRKANMNPKRCFLISIISKMIQSNIGIDLRFFYLNSQNIKGKSRYHQRNTLTKEQNGYK